MQAVSDNLIHFLGREHKGSPKKQLEVFEKIIKLGLRLNRTRITFGDDGSVHNDIVCFTDIPLSLCDEHAANYGKFGLGFNKSSIKKCGGNPARYFIDYFPAETKGKSEADNRGAMYKNLRSHFRLVMKLSDAVRDVDFALYDQNRNEIFSHQQLKEWVDKQFTILSFEKETGDLGSGRDETKIIDSYYKEREWRLVPLYGNLGSMIHKKDDSYYYEFKRNDVNMVVTPNDEIRTRVLKFLLALETETDERLKEFGQNPLPIITYDDLHKW